MDFPHYGDPLAEIGHIWGFWALSGEPVGVNVEGRAEAYRRVLSSCNNSPGYLPFPCSLCAIQASKLKILMLFGRHIGFMLIRNGHR